MTIEVFAAILIFGYPLGVAGQNLILVALLLWLVSHAWKRSKPLTSGLNPSYRSYLIAGIAWIGWQMLTSLGRDDLGWQEILKWGFGYSPLLVVPLLARSQFSKQRCESRRLGQLFLGLVFFWFLIALSQRLTGWAFVGGEIVWDRHRAQGLYSHPLTFAYALIPCLPVALGMLNRTKIQILSIFAIAAVAFLIYVTESRTVQMFSMLFVGYFGVRYLNGRQKAVLGSAIAAIVLYVASTDNPVRAKFGETLSQLQDPSREYADDRLVFWDANSQLWKERPIAGHGIKIPKDLLERAYAAIDRGDFEKMYNAHNQYLQFAVEGGVIGLLLFLWWGVKTYQLHRVLTWKEQRVYCWALVLMALCLLTQNGFQDSEVRYGYLLLVLYPFLYKPKQKPLDSSGS